MQTISNDINNKKLKALLAASLGKIASKYATRAQTAEKISSSKQTCNPDLSTLPDQHILTQINNVLSKDNNLKFSESIT